MRLIALCLMAAGAAAGQTYSGPVPPKADIPYLKHAENLVATEALDAKEEKSKKGDITYVIAGAASSARTPLAAPIFLMRIDKLVASRLALYKLEVRNGRREIAFAPKKPPKAIALDVTRLNDGKMARIEVQESLEPGEYSLSPEGSNQVFCFQVF
jgi:hypothetical protein